MFSGAGMHLSAFVPPQDIIDVQCHACHTYVARQHPPDPAGSGLWTSGGGPGQTGAGLGPVTGGPGPAVAAGDHILWCATSNRSGMHGTYVTWW